MKLMLGNTPVKKMMIHNDTQDATMVASDLQAGVTGYAKGQKVTGTGKAFSFASYGDMWTNEPWPVPSDINIVEIGSLDCFVKTNFNFLQIVESDFTNGVNIANISVNGNEYPIIVTVVNNMITISCEQEMCLQVFYGKDEYV